MNKKNVLQLFLGVLIVFSTGADVGYFFPWYLHLMIGWSILIYASSKLFKENKKKAYIPISLILASLVFTIYMFSKIILIQTPDITEDGSYPYRGIPSHPFISNDDGYTGLVKIKNDMIYIQLNNVDGHIFDSVNVIADDQRYTSNEVFLTTALNEDGYYLRGSTSNNYFRDYNTYYSEQDTLRIGLKFHNQVNFRVKKEMIVAFYSDSLRLNKKVELK